MGLVDGEGFSSLNYMKLLKNMSNLARPFCTPALPQPSSCLLADYLLERMSWIPSLPSIA